MVMEVKGGGSENVKVELEAKRGEERADNIERGEEDAHAQTNHPMMRIEEGEC